MSAPDTTTAVKAPLAEADAPTTPVPPVEHGVAQPTAARGGQPGASGISAKTKNAIIAGGIGLAVGFGLLGFGAGYVVGDSGSSSTTQQFPGGGMNGGGMNGGGMNGGGMNGGGMNGGGMNGGGMNGGGMNGGGMNGGGQNGGGMNGQNAPMPGMGNGQMSGQNGQTQNGQTQNGQNQNGQTQTS